MKTQMEQDFEAILASMEAAPDEELAAELRDYRRSYSTVAKHTPRAGEVALPFRVKPSVPDVAAETNAKKLSLSTLVSGLVFVAGAAFIARHIAIKIGEGVSEPQEYTPEKTLPLHAVPDEKIVLIDQPDFGMVA